MSAPPICKSNTYLNDDSETLVEDAICQRLSLAEVYEAGAVMLVTAIIVFV
jgi:hypothetical protein